MPYVGLSIRSLNDAPGMEIVLVNSDSPGWHSGLKAGDILIEIDGKPVSNIQQYRDIITNGSENQQNSFEFKVLRKNIVKNI